MTPRCGEAETARSAVRSAATVRLAARCHGGGARALLVRRRHRGDEEQVLAGEQLQLGARRAGGVVVARGVLATLPAARLRVTLPFRIVLLRSIRSGLLRHRLAVEPDAHPVRRGDGEPGVDEAVGVDEGGDPGEARAAGASAEIERRTLPLAPGQIPARPRERRPGLRPRLARLVRPRRQQRRRLQRLAPRHPGLRRERRHRRRHRPRHQPAVDRHLRRRTLLRLGGASLRRPYRFRGGRQGQPGRGQHEAHGVPVAARRQVHDSSWSGSTAGLRRGFRPTADCTERGGQPGGLRSRSAKPRRRITPSRRGTWAASRTRSTTRGDSGGPRSRRGWGRPWRRGRRPGARTAAGPPSRPRRWRAG